MSKKCIQCNETKSVEDFYISVRDKKTDKIYRNSNCKSCYNSARKMKVLTKAERHARFVSENTHKTCSAKAGCGKTKVLSEFDKSTTGKGGLQSICKVCRRGKHILRYGISLIDLHALLAKQGYQCAICRSQIAEQNSHVDHDHSCCPQKGSCGKCVRGLLCGRCNLAIGAMEDSPTLLIAAAEYLKEYWKDNF